MLFRAKWSLVDTPNSYGTSEGPVPPEVRSQDMQGYVFFQIAYLSSHSRFAGFGPQARFARLV